jgi:RNA recognition motif-containing protein
MNIYVGNLSHSSTEDSVRNAFEQFGKVEKVKIILDRETGQPRGFAFVEMPNADEAQAAIEKMNNVELDGRSLRVNEAREPERGGGGARPRSFDDRGPRRNNGGGGGGGGFRNRF